VYGCVLHLDIRDGVGCNKNMTSERQGLLYDLMAMGGAQSGYCARGFRLQGCDPCMGL
jgi:hypothetical protein